MKLARLCVSAELFREWCPLPNTTRILGSVRSERPDEIEILVEDDAFPEVPEGETARRVAARFRKNVPVEFVSWNL